MLGLSPLHEWSTGAARVVSLVHVDQYTVSRPTKWVKNKSTGEKSASTEQTLPPRKQEESLPIALWMLEIEASKQRPKLMR